MKIALAQINTTVGDIEENSRKIVEFGKKAAQLKADMVIFPEMAVCGYPPMDILLKESFVSANLEALRNIAADLPDITVLVGFVDRNPGRGRPLHNACALLVDGHIKAVQHKSLLPTYDVFDEDRYFEPAKSCSIVNVKDCAIGLSICEDIWNDADWYPRPRYQIDPVERIMEQRAQLLVNISASPYTVGKEDIRYELVRKQALKHGVPVAYVNQVGANDELIFDGRSIVIDARGELIGQAHAFKEDLILVDLETGKGDVRDNPEDETANICEALTLGTADYMRKCGFKKALIGLSGGIDSAVVCAIAARAIGPENVTGVAMPSPYSSEGSLTDAKALADSIGIDYKVIPIEEPMKAFDRALAPAFAGMPHDITEENIQARSRGVILMALSNKFGYLVLTTGNKSELAVGYCTLYGDMCGGLAVISDLPKMQVYELAHYLNKEAGREIIPKNTLEKAPSAELRPGQTDQDTLPPYSVLDQILHAYVEERKNPSEIVALGHKPEVVMDVINRIDRNEYKRHQAAPGLKVSARSFGFGWRMPIAHRFREKIKENPLKC